MSAESGATDIIVQDKTKEDIDRDEARAHIEKTCDELQVRDSKELKRLAKRHMDMTACTIYDEESDKYRYRPCCGTKIADLGVYGSGVSLYFHFIFQMGIVFFLCSIITGGNLYLNISGGMVVENNVLYRYFGMSTIANLGACQSGRCSTAQELEDRCIMDSFPCPMRLKEMTQWIGLADGVGILFIMAWGLFFQRYWIPRVARTGNRRNLAPSDFAVDVAILPARLSQDHENYENLMKAHFEDVLKRLSIDDPNAIQEIALVREYGGSISKFMQKGKNLHSQQGDLIKMKQLKGRDDEASKRNMEALEKAATKKFRKMKAIDASLAKQAEMMDEDRSVARAFVTFSQQTYQQAVLDEYRFSGFWLFRCFQNQFRRFGGSVIKVQKACEPSDLFWENLDYAWWKRGIRKAIVLLLTLVVLVLCSLALLYAQSMSKATLASGNEQLVWIVKTTPKSNATCMELCDVDLFSDRACSHDGQAPKVVRTFDAAKDYTTFDWSTAGCSAKWTSPACSNHQACGNGASRDWVGFQFQSPRQAQCFQLKLSALRQVKEVQLFGCMSPPPEASNRGCWKVEDHCEPMYTNDLSKLRLPTGQAYVHTGNQQISADMTCSATIAEAVARERWKSFAQGSAERTSNPILSCFCQQQLLNKGPQFLLPPYDSSAKQICEEWSGSNNVLIGKLLSAAAAVVIINQVLVFIYQLMVKWERHCTVTEVAQSQFWKLFLAQFTNTGLLVLLVNASLKKLPAVLLPLRVLSIGTGQYDDFSISWYISVGFGLCLTIFMQIFSTTVPPLIMSFIVKPCMAYFWGRGEVVEARMNMIYQLPDWNLALRMAQTLTVIFVICTYSAGMPALYTVGLVYSVIAFWLDKWCLLHGSTKPPAFNDTIWHTCMHFLPMAAFLHTALACWTFGNQALVPSDWSLLRPIAEMVFGISSEKYTESINAYRNAADSLKGDLQSDYFNARMLDFARSSCWLLLLIFLTFCVYYIFFWVLKLFLYPFVAPCLFAVRDACKARSSSQVSDGTWDDCVKACSLHNTLVSYKLQANHKYHSAFLAISHTSQQVKASLL